MSPNPIEPVVDVVLSAEVAHTPVRRVPAERVRISKRVVTETRTITVEVRREELHVERLTLPASETETDSSGSASAAGPVLVMVLYEEVPEVVNRVVAVERAEVFIDKVAGTETVTMELRHEEAELVEDSRPST